MREILHVDMDAFYASIEQRDDPALRGKPVLVGGTGRRGVVMAASYEARAFGCRSAQPTAVARRLCPQAIAVRGRFHVYQDVSRQVFDILESFTPLVQPLSIDEAFLDVTGCTALHGPAREIAVAIRTRIRDELELTASVGVAPNKFLAKLASDLDKPDGLVVIKPNEIDRVLEPLEVERIMGVGPAAAGSLHRIGVKTIADLKALSAETLEERFGSFGHRLWQLARGLDERRVVCDHDAKTIGHEQTFGENLKNSEDVHRVMAVQSEDVASRLRRHGLYARTVVVKIRYGNFETITRSGTLDSPTDRTDVLIAESRRLFDSWTFRPVRLIGVTASQLSRSGVQEGLFRDPDEERQRSIDSAVDVIVDRFGRGSLRRGASVVRGDSGPKA